MTHIKQTLFLLIIFISVVTFGSHRPADSGTVSGIAYGDTIPECEADFIMHPDSGVNVPFFFHFHDISPNEPDTWFWEFGDGHTSSAQHPTHQYSAGGTYEVSLTVTKFNPEGEDCTDTRSVEMQTPAYFHIGGFVYAGNFPINNPEPTGDTAMVYLYRYHNNNSIVSMDTSVVIENGYYHALFLLESDYMIKFRLTDGSANATGYFPTYFGDKLKWQNTPVFSLADSSHYHVDVSLVKIPEHEGGAGTISGQVIYQDSGNVRLPAGNSEVLIFDDAGQAIRYVHSSDDGTFQCGNLAWGTYTLYAESTGMFTAPVTVTLSQENPGAYGVQIDLTESDPTSVNEPAKYRDQQLRAYPNPVQDNLFIVLKNRAGDNYNCKIFDPSGREILSQTITFDQAGVAKLNVSKLPKGFFLIKVISGDGRFSETVKLVK
jgi:PKD repeat protein